jgi:hypothetical protein
VAQCAKLTAERAWDRVGSRIAGSSPNGLFRLLRMFSLLQVVRSADITAKAVTSPCVGFSGMQNAGCSETKLNGCGILPVKL